MTWNDREKLWQARYELVGGGWKVLGMFETKVAASRKYEAYAAKAEQKLSRVVVASAAGGAKNKKRVSSAAFAVVEEDVGDDDDDEEASEVEANEEATVARAIASTRNSSSKKRARPSNEKERLRMQVRRGTLSSEETAAINRKRRVQYQMSKGFGTTSREVAEMMVATRDAKKKS